MQFGGDTGIDHHHVGINGACKCIRGSASGKKGSNHYGRDTRGITRNALFRQPVIAGEDRNQAALIYAEMAAIIDDPDSRVAQRMADMAAFYRFMQERLPMLLTEWEAYRTGRD